MYHLNTLKIHLYKAEINLQSFYTRNKVFV